MLEIVDEELVAVFVAGVAQALHRLCLEQALLVAETAELQLVGPDMLGEIARGGPGRSRFKHEYADPAFGEFFGDPSAAGAGADDHHLMDLFARNWHAADSVAKTWNSIGEQVVKPAALPGSKRHSRIHRRFTK